MFLTLTLLGLLNFFVVASIQTFLSDTSHRSAISSDHHRDLSRHDQRSHFADCAAQGIASVGVQTVSLVAQSASANPFRQPFYAPQSKGFHYNRPPPIS
jgi:hypothetical protein